MIYSPFRWSWGLILSKKQYPLRECLSYFRILLIKAYSKFLKLMSSISFIDSSNISWEKQSTRRWPTIRKDNCIDQSQRLYKIYLMNTKQKKNTNVLNFKFIGPFLSKDGALTIWIRIRIRIRNKKIKNKKSSSGMLW